MSVLLLVGIALLAFVAIRMFLSRRAPARPAMQYAGGPIGGTTAPRGYETQVPPAAYEAPVGGGAPSAAPVRDADAPLRPNVPVGFDAEGFAREAKSQFARLQAAFDRGDRSLLADVMTPTMFAEVARDLPAASGHPTEIVALSAEVLEAVTEGDQHWASVRFRGLLREDGEPMPKPFDEVWNLVKPADGSSGWLLAGIQQLDEAPVGHA